MTCPPHPPPISSPGTPQHRPPKPPHCGDGAVSIPHPRTTILTRLARMALCAGRRLCAPQTYVLSYLCERGMHVCMYVSLHGARPPPLRTNGCCVFVFVLPGPCCCLLCQATPHRFVCLGSSGLTSWCWVFACACCFRGTHSAVLCLLGLWLRFVVWKVEGEGVVSDL